MRLFFSQFIVFHSRAGRRIYNRFHCFYFKSFKSSISCFFFLIASDKIFDPAEKSSKNITWKYLSARGYLFGCFPSLEKLFLFVPRGNKVNLMWNKKNLGRKTCLLRWADRKCRENSTALYNQMKIVFSFQRKEIQRGKNKKKSYDCFDLTMCRFFHFMSSLRFVLHGRLKGQRP